MRAENTVGLRSNASEIKEFTYKYHAMEECVKNWTASSTNNPGEILVKWAPVNDSTHLDKYGITVTLTFLDIVKNSHGQVVNIEDMEGESFILLIYILSVFLGGKFKWFSLKDKPMEMLLSPHSQFDHKLLYMWL